MGAGYPADNPESALDEAAATLMALYECWWTRYFRSARTLADFYSGFCGVPVAGATLPVAAFLLLGVYGRVIWMVLAVAILGIGHIGIHLRHRRELLQGRPVSFPKTENRPVS